MRRLLKAVARGEEITQDVSTLENPAIVAQLRGGAGGTCQGGAATCGAGEEGRAQGGKEADEEGDEEEGDEEEGVARLSQEACRVRRAAARRKGCAPRARARVTGRGAQAIPAGRAQAGLRRRTPRALSLRGPRGARGGAPS